jgi:hypothetical protein
VNEEALAHWGAIAPKTNQQTTIFGLTLFGWLRFVQQTHYFDGSMVS